MLEPYEQMQADTKHILDAGALPRDVYENIKRKDLPLYEWNIIDAKTRMRFTAYSYRLNSTLGMIFLLLVVMETYPKNCVSIKHPPRRDYTSNS